MRYILALALLGCKGPEPADTVFTGGHVHTAVGQAPKDGLALRAGIVVATGEDVDAHIGSDTQVVELDGAHVYPGFQDAHTHVLAGNFAMDRLLLQGVSSMEGLANRVADYAEGAPNEPWIVGYGWFPELLEELSIELLDDAVSDRPVILVSNSGHEALVNSHALDLAGIDGDTPDPPGGHIKRDAHGEPNGILVEAGVALVSDLVLAAYDDATLGGGLDQRLEEFAQSGITHLHEILAVPGFDIGRPWIFADLEASDQLPLRVTWYVPVFHADDLDHIAEDKDLWEGELVRFGGAKIWVDGSMGTVEAWVSEPYESDPSHYGSYWFDEEELTGIVAKAEALEIPLKLHVNGDAAIEAALTAFEALPEGPTLPHVLDHVVLPQDDHQVRIAALGLVASVQPTHHIGATLGNTAAELGDRFDHAYDFRSLADAGVNLAMGTDWPVWPSHQPLLVLFNTANREGSLSVEEAMRGYTEGGATALGQDDLGRLEVGHAADLVVFDQDPLDVPLDAVSSIEVRQTWVAGQRRF